MASKVYDRVPSDEVKDLLRELKGGDATRITKARNVDGTFRKRRARQNAFFLGWTVIRGGRVF
jgi:hypothetical protein